MISFTKNNVGISTVQGMMEKAGLPKAVSLSALGDGEYNAAYLVVDETGKKYALKVAPKMGIRLMTYEYGIMKTEVAVLKLIAEKTDVKVPAVVWFEENSELTNSDWCIFEFLEGTPMNKAKLSKQEKASVMFDLGASIRKIHDIEGDGFGYLQYGLKSTWKEAYLDMVKKIQADGADLGQKLYKPKKIDEILKRADKVLDSVKKPSLVHFDIWTANLFVKDGHLDGLIDTERAMFGDFMGDFVMIEPMKKPEKLAIWKGYNSGDADKILLDNNLKARFYLTLLYLTLIMIYELDTRVKKSFYYHIRRLFAKYLCSTCLKNLDKLLD